MPKICPSSDLRNSYGEISDYCNTRREPVFITKNGRDDLVVMASSEYDLLAGRFELAALLDRGLSDASQGKHRAATDVFADIEQRHEL